MSFTGPIIVIAIYYVSLCTVISELQTLLSATSHRTLFVCSRECINVYRQLYGNIIVYVLAIGVTAVGGKRCRDCSLSSLPYLGIYVHPYVFHTFPKCFLLVLLFHSQMTTARSTIAELSTIFIQRILNDSSSFFLHAGPGYTAAACSNTDYCFPVYLRTHISYGLR